MRRALFERGIDLLEPGGAMYVSHATLVQKTDPIDQFSGKYDYRVVLEEPANGTVHQIYRITPKLA